MACEDTKAEVETVMKKREGIRAVRRGAAEAGTANGTGSKSSCPNISLMKAELSRNIGERGTDRLSERLARLKNVDNKKRKKLVRLPSSASIVPQTTPFTTLI